MGDAQVTYTCPTNLTEAVCWETQMLCRTCNGYPTGHPECSCAALRLAPRSHSLQSYDPRPHPHPHHTLTASKANPEPKADANPQPHNLQSGRAARSPPPRPVLARHHHHQRHPPSNFRGLLLPPTPIPTYLAPAGPSSRGPPQPPPSCSGVRFVQNFENIPTSMWYMLVTISTVGYGDFAPRTVHLSPITPTFALVRSASPPPYSTGPPCARSGGASCWAR